MSEDKKSQETNINKMKMNLINKFSAIAFGAAVLLSLAPTVLAAAQFNTASGDRSTLQVVNATTSPYTNSAWSNSANVNAGDVLNFLVFYHNTGDATATNTRLKINLPTSISSGSLFVTGYVTSDRTSQINGNTSVTLNGIGSQSLTYINGSAKWYTGSSSVWTSIPSGQTGDEVVNSFNGVNIGNVPAGGSGYMLIRVQVGTNNINSGSAPYIATASYTNLIQSNVTLNGSVNPNSSSTTAWFEYGQTQSLGSTTSTSAIGGGTSQTSFSATASSLSSNTTYYYRAVAQNSYGTVRGSILSFTTVAEQQQQGGAPVARTEATSGVSTTSATLSGSVNPTGVSTEGWFEYGTTQSFGSSTSRQNIGSGTVFNNFSSSVTNLYQNTTYYYRAIAQNNLGTNQGTTLSFTTQSQQVFGGAPLVNTSSSSGVSTSSATLYSSINPNNSSTTAWFEYGATQSFGFATSSSSIGSGNSSNSFSASVFNLSSNTTYYYRAVAQNSYGITYGSILSFTTQGNVTNTTVVTNNQDLSGLSNSLSQLNLALSGLVRTVANRSTTNTQTIVERVVQVASVGNGLAKLTLTADKSTLNSGDTVVITAEINALTDINKASLQINLASSLVFDSSVASVFNKSGNTITYSLGNIVANSIQIVKLNAHLSKDVDTSKVTKVTTTGTLNYSNSTGATMTPLFASLDVNVGGSSLLASIFGAFGWGSGLTIFLIALLILLIAIAVKRLMV